MIISRRHWKFFRKFETSGPHKLEIVI